MGRAATIGSGILGGTATKLTRSVTRRAMHDQHGAPRLPWSARHRSGLGTMLAWAVAMGVFLAVADVLREQRKFSAPGAGDLDRPDDT